MGANASAAIPYPVSSDYTATLGEVYSPDSSIGVCFNSNGIPVSANGTVLNGRQWEAYTSNGSGSVLGTVPSSYITKTQGIGSDFKYSLAFDGTTLTSQITFKENTLISQFTNAVQANGMTVSNYAWSTLAPLKFNLENLLGTKYAKTGLPTPILTRLVIFTVGNFTIMNAYDNDAGNTTFADDNIQVFKYITPTITILPSDAYAALTSSSSSNSSSKTTSISL